MSVMNRDRRTREGGNVLFLILIAVALFAALSYVVTQSSRSGVGSTEKEKAVLSASQMTQYPTALRSTILRMIIAGVSIDQIKFDPPATTGPFVTLSSSQLVFHSGGGAAVYQDAPGDLIANGTPTSWTYNANFDIPGVGLDGPGGNDLVAFLPNVSTNVCLQANQKLGLSTGGCTLAANTVAPNISGVNVLVDGQDTQASGYVFPTTNQTDLAPAGCANVFRAQAAGCFYDVTGARYVFYSVLIER